MEHVHLVTVTLVIAAPYMQPNVEAYLADAVNEILREEQRDFATESCLLDYRIDELKLIPVMRIDSEHPYEEGSAT